MDTTLDTDMARGLLMPSLDMVTAMLLATHTEAPRVCMDTMEVMAMVDIMARGPLSQVMAMLSAITTEAPRVSTDTMEVTDMVVIMARGQLSQDIMAVPALMSTRAVLITMDLMAMVSTTMARGLLMLDIMAMEWLAATSRLTGHTLPMVSVLLTLTK